MKMTPPAALIGFALCLSGCATWFPDLSSQPSPDNPAEPMANVCAAAASPCATPPTYEVSWDNWCAGTCNAHPVSHRSPARDCDDQRVEYRGTPTATACNRR